MQIHQFVHTLNYGDAISGEAIAIQRLLQESGFESRIYSVHAHEKVSHLAVNWRQYEQDLASSAESDSIVMLHYSIASELNTVFRQASGIKRAIVYHNLTPSRWFQAYNKRVFEDLELGRQELPELLSAADIILADSEYNKSELLSLGFSDVEVLPLLIDLKKWSVEANPGISNAMKASNISPADRQLGVQCSAAPTNILHVGRLAPNKCIEDIIKAFYFYHHKIEKNSKLWLVGIDIDTEIYAVELRRLVSKLQLKEAVHFVGSVADSELKSMYQSADLYMCMSEHEGFCLPLLEAMYFGVPVIAFDACAVANTLGEAGILLKEKAPAEVAELMNLVLSSDEPRNSLIKCGRERVTEFTSEPFEKAFKECFLSRLGNEPLHGAADSSMNSQQAGIS